MSKKLSLIAASIIVFAFVFVSIVHACSGLTSINPAMEQRSMGMGASDAPCTKENLDICKSIRDGMLSVKPSFSTPEQMIALLQLSMDAPSPLVPTSVPHLSGAGVHPVFNLPLSLSYRVLRI